MQATLFLARRTFARVGKGSTFCTNGRSELPPISLEVPLRGPQLREGVRNNPILRMLVWFLGFHSKESELLRGSDNLIEATKEQIGNKKLFEAVELPQRFATMHGMYCVHVWMILNRLKKEGRDGARLSQMMYDKFQNDVDLLVRKEGVKVGVSKWLKTLEKNFYGSCLAYDKAMEDEDISALSHCLYTNVYQQEGEESSASLLAKYIRREIQCLSLTDSKAMLSGCIKFSDNFT